MIRILKYTKQIISNVVYVWYFLDAFHAIKTVDSITILWQMLWCRLLLIVVGKRIGCESCGPIYLNKWEGVGTIYHVVEAPKTASISLYACSRWCMEKSNCMILSWSPGSCWQVGHCGTANVTGKVYDLHKDAISGWCLKLSLYHVHCNWIVEATLCNNKHKIFNTYFSHHILKGPYPSA